MDKWDKEILRGACRAEAARLSEELAPIYAELRWEWAETGVPDRDDIFKCFCHLIDEVLDKGNFYCATGGLEVSWEGHEDERTRDYLVLSFTKSVEVYPETVLGGKNG